MLRAAPARYSSVDGIGVERGTVSRRGELLDCRVHEAGVPARSLRRALPTVVAPVPGEGLQPSSGLAEDVLASPGPLGRPGAGAAQAELDGRSSRARLGSALPRGGCREAGGVRGAPARRESLGSACRDRGALGQGRRRQGKGAGGGRGRGAFHHSKPRAKQLAVAETRQWLDDISSCGRPGSGQSIWTVVPRGWSTRP